MATEWIDADSTNLKRFKYEPDLEILVIEFQNDKMYYYYDVPQKIFDDLSKASSKGKYFATNIRYNFHYVESKSLIKEINSYMDNHKTS